MPRDSSGNYTLPAGNPVISGSVITSSWANSTMSDIAAALTDSLSRSGNGGMLSPLFFGDGALLDPGIAWALEPSMGFYRNGTQDMRLGIGNRSVLRFTYAEKLEIQRDYGSGLEYNPAVDTKSMSLYWDAKLAGYADTGVHGGYAGDLDDLKTNSCWFISPASVTNEPTDFVGDGFIVTERVAPSSGTQTIYGRFGADSWKQWMRTDTNDTWGDWKLVVDGGAFTERLAGYADTGLHESYNADLNDITVNGKWTFVKANVTNEPSDFANSYGFITHDETTAGGNRATQTIIGAWSGNQYKMWMRQCTNSRVWEDWKLVVDGGSLTITSGDRDYTGIQTAPKMRASDAPAGASDLTRKDYVDAGDAATLASANSYTDSAVANVLAVAFPVGSVVIGWNPSGVLTGTWSQLAEGTFLMCTRNGSDPSGGNNDAAVIAHTHTINHNHTASASTQTADHTHQRGEAFAVNNGTAQSVERYAITGASQSSINLQSHSHNITVDAFNGNSGSAGEAATGRNRPKYVGKLMYERTA